MLERFKITITRLLFSYNWEVIEIQGAVFKITWGIWLLLPFNTFKAIEGYFAVGTENLWGWGLLVLGFIHLVAIFSGNLLFRRWVAFMAFLFWLFSIVLFWEQAHSMPLIPTFGVIAFFMCVNFLRLGVQIKITKLIDEKKLNLGEKK